MRSRAQRSYLWIHHPEIARRWEKVTPKGKKLPEHVKKAEPGPPPGISLEKWDKILQKLPKKDKKSYYTTGIKQALANFGLI